MDDDHTAAHKLQSAFGGDGKPRSPGISIAGLRRTSSRGRIYGVGIAEDKIDREFTDGINFRRADDRTIFIISDGNGTEIYFAVTFCD